MNVKSMLRRTMIIALMLCWQLLAHGQYTPLSVTGFNADVVANGAGPANSSTSADADGVGYAFLAPDFGTPPYSLPASRIVNSAAINGVRYQLAAYNGLNTLRLPSSNSTGILQFGSPVYVSEFYLLGTSGNGSCHISVTLGFADGSSELVSNNIEVKDWFGGTPFSIRGFGRVDRNNNRVDGGPDNPRLYDLRVPVSAGNRSKGVVQITITKRTTGTSVLLVMGVSGLKICDPPSGIGVVSSTQNSADIAWSASPMAVSGYEWRVTPAGNAVTSRAVDSGLTAALTATVNRMSSGVRYWFYIRSFCGPANTEPGAWSGPFLFASVCNGMPYAGLISMGSARPCSYDSLLLTTSGASFGSGISYRWQESPAGAATWTDLVVTTDTFIRAGYPRRYVDYRVIVSCAASGGADTSPSVRAEWQLCYCTPVFQPGVGRQCGSDMNIDTFSYGGIQRRLSGCATSAEQLQLQEVALVQAGVPVQLSAKRAGSSSANMAVYADLNTDGDFDDPLEFLTAGKIANYSNYITIDRSVPPGDYRMRVLIDWFNVLGAGEACRLYPAGGWSASVIWYDMTLRVLPPIPCDPPSSLTVGNVFPGRDFNLSWTAPGRTPAGYVWRLMPAGVPVNGHATDSGYVTSPGASSSKVVLNQDYDLYVRSVCAPGDTSVWNGPQSFRAAKPRCAGIPRMLVVTPPVSNLSCDGARMEFHAVDMYADTVDGIIYRWQSGALSSGPWQNMAGADTLNLEVAGVTTDTWYRLASVCSYTGDTAFSSANGIIARITPAITMHPQSDTVCKGLPVAINVQALGNHLTYEWLRDGVVIATGIGNSWTRPAVMPSDQGVYTVRVSNLCGNDTSQDANLRVVDAGVARLVQPAIRSACLGDSIKLLATGGGVDAVYEWLSDGVLIPGAADSAYMVRTTGGYQVAVAGPDGICADTSTVQRLVLDPRPVANIVTGSVVRICVGNSAILEAAPAAGVQYQWMRNGQLISGQAGSAYQTSDPGSYVLIVSLIGGNCADTSAPSAVSVHQPPVVSIKNNDGVLNAGAGYDSYQWSLNGIDIIGETDSLYRPIVSGNYMVTISDTNGCTVTATFMHHVGISRNVTDDQQVRVFPNPASDKVYTDIAGLVDMRMYTMDGKLIRVANQVTQIDVSDIPQGIYLLYIVVPGQQVQVEKVRIDR